MLDRFSGPTGRSLALSLLLLLIAIRTQRIPVLERYEIMLAAAWVLATRRCRYWGPPAFGPVPDADARQRMRDFIDAL